MRRPTWILFKVALLSPAVRLRWERNHYLTEYVAKADIYIKRACVSRTDTYTSRLSFSSREKAQQGKIKKQVISSREIEGRCEGKKNTRKSHST
mmetsp:Transcript_30433/g.58604  ORF Transcript_30433/g.58604 Transcript_30433/m.58604 type:complete len:94 (-) Transcript_30433:346-627(-)